jgi:lipopolysaccharide biosynthesis glycosyltransferase
MEHYDIVFCLDNNYVNPSIVAIKSILLTNKDVDITFHIISDESLTELSKEILQKKTQESKSKIIIYTFASSIFNSYPVLKHISISMYFRFMIPLLLPKSIEKVLYLDSDLIVLDSLKDLWETNIKSYSAATPLSIGSKDKEYLRRLEIDETFGYFCSGVLLLNLKYWRENNIFESLIHCIKSQQDKLIFYDQDALNLVLHKTKINVPLYWDITYSFLMDKEFWGKNSEFSRYDGDVNVAIENPKIIHFNGAIKPWFFECTHPYRECWQYLNNTLNIGDRDFRLKYYHRNPLKIIRYFIKKIVNNNTDKRFLKSTYKTANSYTNYLRMLEVSNGG